MRLNSPARAAVCRELATEEKDLKPLVERRWAMEQGRRMFEQIPRSFHALAPSSPLGPSASAATRAARRCCLAIMHPEILTRSRYLR